MKLVYITVFWNYDNYHNLTRKTLQCTFFVNFEFWFKWQNYLHVKHVCQWWYRQCFVVQIENIRLKFYQVLIVLNNVLRSLSNITRDFFYDVYTILNRIWLTICTMCAFRVMNPNQWSLTKQSRFKSLKWLPESAKTSWSQKEWCKKPTQLQFQSILIQKTLMLSKRYEFFY